MFAACQAFGSRMLWRGCQGLSGSPLLLFHVGTNETGSRNLECSRRDYIALEVKAKGTGAQVASPWFFQWGERAWWKMDASPGSTKSCTASVDNRGLAVITSLRIEEKMASTWPSGTSTKWQRIFVNKLANLGKRALNWEWRDKEGR